MILTLSFTKNKILLATLYPLALHSQACDLFPVTRYDVFKVHIQARVVFCMCGHLREYLHIFNFANSMLFEDKMQYTLQTVVAI